MKTKVLSGLYLLTTLLLLDYTTPVTSLEVLTELGVSVDLPCSVVLPDPDPRLLEVSWLRNRTLVATSIPGGKTEPGYFLNMTHSLNGSFPLTVRNASLAQRGEYECSVLYNSTLLNTSTITLLIKVPPVLSVLSSTVVLGRESVLQCEATGFFPPQISFLWTARGQEGTLAAPVPVVTPLTPGGSLSLYRAVSGLPLTVSPPANPNLTFDCEVMHMALKKRLRRQLKPTYIYLPEVSVSTVATSQHSSPLTLSCDINGFSPQNLTVSWVQNGSVLPEPPPVELNLDGTFRTQRFYTLSEEQREQAGQVQCVVNQPHIAEPVYGTINLTEADPLVQEVILTKSAKASVAMMIISLTLVFLLCFGFSWRRRDEKQKSLSVSGVILPPRVIVGQKGRITISIEGRRADRVQTAWFLNDLPIADTSGTGPTHSARASRVSIMASPPYSGRLSRVSVSSLGEKGPLLPLVAPGYYKLHTQQPLHSVSTGNKQMLSSVTFMPHLTHHKGAVFKCQVSYKGKDKVVVERVSDKFTVMAPPQVSEIKMSDCGGDADTTMLTVQASRFHPDVITFRWFCEGGELSPVAMPPALAAPRPDSEGFFSASSQCRLPRAELERGGTRVWVTVHHIALKQPITRETRGFIKKPTVSEISVTNDGAAPVLSCDVTGFYPPELSVTWLQLKRTEERSEDMERRKGEEEEDDDDDDDEEDEERVEVTEGTELWGPLLTEPRTFRATAVLQGAEPGRSKVKGEGPIEAVVCRVDHCSLQAPVERLWRRAHTVPPSIPASLSVRWRGDGVGVFSVSVSGGSRGSEFLWAAGGATLTPLSSCEEDSRGGGGVRRATSSCLVKRSSAEPEQDTNTHTNGVNGVNGVNGHAYTPKSSMLACEAEVAFIDEDEDDGVRRPEPKTHTEEEKKEEEQRDTETELDEELDFSSLNIVRLPDDDTLRVTVEITHPALNAPVYRTWTETNGDVRL
ncbi:uncharacterized protein si:ch211-180a12.2 [Engraulis encrasicolus]|uniref:uncharacterized protein si:ch211-180a12.2 n=1 Tax=Engraulis encrasicolus TaxID=184585 RepID=UPI002FD5EF32